MNLKYMIPAVLFAGVAATLAVGLTLKPGDLPSMMINQQVPEFDLRVVQIPTGDDLRSVGAELRSAGGASSAAPAAS